MQENKAQWMQGNIIQPIITVVKFNSGHWCFVFKLMRQQTFI